MILQRLPIERQAFFLFPVRLRFLIEATLGLVPQPLVLEHLVEEIRQLKVAALVAHVLGHVPHHVAENIEAD